MAVAAAGDCVHAGGEARQLALLQVALGGVEVIGQLPAAAQIGRFTLTHQSDVGQTGGHVVAAGGQGIVDQHRQFTLALLQGGRLFAGEGQARVVHGLLKGRARLVLGWLRLAAIERGAGGGHGLGAAAARFAGTDDLGQPVALRQQVAGLVAHNGLFLVLGQAVEGGQGVVIGADGGGGVVARRGGAVEGAIELQVGQQVGERVGVAEARLELAQLVVGRRPVAKAHQVEGAFDAFAIVFGQTDAGGAGAARGVAPAAEEGDAVRLIALAAPTGEEVLGLAVAAGAEEGDAVGQVVALLQQAVELLTLLGDLGRGGLGVAAGPDVEDDAGAGQKG